MNPTLPRRNFLKLSLGAAGTLGAADLLAQAPAPTAPQPPRLIVRGDDMGYSHAGNEAIIKACREGIETSIEVIVPSPWFPEAVRMLAENPAVDVGVHLALTSEWDNIKWRPLTPCPSLVDENGYFWPRVQPSPHTPGRSIRENKWRLDEIEREFRAQIEMARRHIPRLSHASGHMGCTGFDPQVTSLTSRLLQAYGLHVDFAKFNVQNLRFAGPKKTPAEKYEGFMKILAGLNPGGVYLFVEHPGLDSPELRAIHHAGYEDVATDRQGVTDLWTDPRVKEEIRRRRIQLISYRDLKRS